MPDDVAFTGRSQDGLLHWIDPDVVLELLEQSLPDGILCTYASVRECPIYYISEALLSRLGYDREEFARLYGEDFHRAIYEEDAPEIALGVRRVVESQLDGVLKFRLRKKDGELVWFRDTLRFVRLADGREMLVSVLSDISDIMELQRHEELRARELAEKNDQISRERDERARAADMDGMTGLYNREATMRRIGEYLENDGSLGTHALLIIDVDDFKIVNDTFGHQTGDSVLVDVAVAIRGCFRDTDIVGRIGGDEFFVLMKNVARRDAVRRKAGELVEALRLACVSQDTRMELSGSVGASISEGGKPLEKLYEEADTALYKAKLFGKNQYAFADETCSQGREATEESEMPGLLRMRSILEQMAGDMLVLEIRDGDIHVLYTGRSLFSAVGCDPRDAEKREVSLFAGVCEKDAETLRAEILRAASDNAPLDWAYRARSEDGGVRWLHIRGECMPERSGKVRRMVCARADISRLMERKPEIEAASRQGDFDGDRWSAICKLLAGECEYLGLLNASTGRIASPSGETLDSAIRRTVRSAEIALAAKELAPETILSKLDSLGVYERSYPYADPAEAACGTCAIACRWLDADRAFALVLCRRI